jgi:hypothetical protein
MWLKMMQNSLAKSSNWLVFLVPRGDTRSIILKYNHIYVLAKESQCALLLTIPQFESIEATVVFGRRSVAVQIPLSCYHSCAI